MFVHIKHASLTGSGTLMIVIFNTDVVVLDIAGMLICILRFVGSIRKRKHSLMDVDS